MDPYGHRVPQGAMSQRAGSGPQSPSHQHMGSPGKMGGDPGRVRRNASSGGSFGLLNAGQRASSQSLGRGVLYVCFLQFIVSIAVVYASVQFLYSFTSATGTILGGLLCAMSVVGMLGAYRNSRNFLNVYLVGTLLVMILCFHFVSEVQREVNVDCALAGAMRSDRSPAIFCLLNPSTTAC